MENPSQSMVSAGKHKGMMGSQIKEVGEYGNTLNKGTRMLTVTI